ncbi:type II secretion system minor pseudopilin GspJ [Colwellia sp. D2M02]|uniref:type II secretion system minor pseudopilin GspJ n=1 Tax=Colwellia sp. D2M02 TaxID=2841562 RepID=UPI001C09F8A7|nr:type II secretion system minor pseudopilin GspJ [Colwellia sp. D2M02]MBU2891746.1 type II secretion system minor pseudopilin GspJ [Colwellia sp. D2M02]
MNIVLGCLSVNQSATHHSAVLNKADNKGFTLLELIIAIAIFSVVSLAGFTIFDTVLKGDANSKVRSERQNELQRAFLLIERDFLQIAKRTMRIEGEAPGNSFLLSSDDNFLANEQAIAFVRHGWTNPGLLLPRSDLQSVAYRLVDNTLERLHYNFVDAVVGEAPKIRPLIALVESVAFEFYDGKKWQNKWSGNNLPLAIAIEIETSDFGLIRRQFLVAGEAQSTDAGGNP